MRVIIKKGIFKDPKGFVFNQTNTVGGKTFRGSFKKQLLSFREEEFKMPETRRARKDGQGGTKWLRP
jgi:hypothetical protein